MGGKTDAALMRLVDMMLAIPGLVLALLVAGLLGPGLTNTVISVGIINTQTCARIARGTVLSIRPSEHFSARAAGGSDWHII